MYILYDSAAVDVMQTTTVCCSTVDPSLFHMQLLLSNCSTSIIYAHIIPLNSAPLPPAPVDMWSLTHIKTRTKQP